VREIQGTVDGLMVDTHKSQFSWFRGSYNSSLFEGNAAEPNDDPDYEPLRPAQLPDDPDADNHSEASG